MSRLVSVPVSRSAHQDNILTCHGLSKTYQDGVSSVPVFANLNFSVCSGELIAIVGPSGSGKSTLLQLLGGLDQPTSGSVSLFGKVWADLSENEKCALRNRHLGFIYQFHHLLPEFSALENVCMPLLIAGNYDTRPAEVILENVGLKNRLHHRVQTLSGGERQRVAIARALVHQPACILADEPTGNLDQATSDIVFALLLNLTRQSQSSIVMVTHNMALAKKCDRVLVLEDGALIQKPSASENQ